MKPLWNSDVRSRESRLAGRCAYHNGDGPECPYPRHGSMDTLRVAWCIGYHEARLADRLPKHFSLPSLGDAGEDCHGDTEEDNNGREDDNRMV